MNLRWYQSEAIDAVYDYLCNKQGNPIIALPTGTGKSYVIAELTRLMMVHFRSMRIINLTHVKELIVQNMLELKGIWPAAPVGVYSASVGKKEHHYPITFAGIGTIHNKTALFGKIDLLIIDECHLVSQHESTMYRKFVDKLTKINPHLRVIGLTATAWRLSSGHLTQSGLFTDVCYDLTTPHAFTRLMADGYLVPLVPKRTRLQYDMSCVHTIGGDYKQDEMQQAIDVDQLTIEAVREIIAQAKDRKHVLIFAAGVAHAEHVTEALTRMDFENKTAFVHSRISGDERDDRIKAFKAGKLKYLVNNTILTTGFNFPALDMIVVLFATKSASKWVQVLGRGTRPAPGKNNCLVLDFAGNTQRLGPINDPYIPDKKKKGGGVAPVKLCPECDTYNHASATVCAECGHKFLREYKFNTTAATDRLISGDAPQVEDFDVDRVAYSRHEKPGSYPSLLVSYYCGLRVFKEWVCLEHPTRVKNIAHRWWRTRTEMPIPSHVEEALENTHKLQKPARIKVWLNTKHPEILKHEFQ